jgi:hypothetical protein
LRIRPSDRLSHQLKVSIAQMRKESYRRSAKLTSLVRWIVSTLYLLAMVWSLLSRTDGYQPWLALEVAAVTASYGILMMLLWPHEPRSPIARARVNQP